MKKQQVWLTEDECDLARRLCDFVLSELDANTAITESAKNLACRWTNHCVQQLRIKFAWTRTPEP